MFNIVLVEPEIPPNTGNIARTCAATGAKLHLVGPLGFSIDDRDLKRAGLDYWEHLDWEYYESFDAFQTRHPNGRFFFLTTRGGRSYDSIAYQPGDFLVFGKETAGLPSRLLEANKERALRLPMKPGIRSLNLANAVAIVLYEALRQTGYQGLV